MGRGVLICDPGSGKDTEEENKITKDGVAKLYENRRRVRLLSILPVGNGKREMRSTTIVGDVQPGATSPIMANDNMERNKEESSGGVRGSYSRIQ